jgi:hypothetical protein
MADKNFPKSNLPIRRSVELLPTVFQTEANDKFLSGVLDPLTQPGVLDKVVGYIGRRYGKTFSGNDVYVDTDQTLRSRYQLEPGVIYKNQEKIENFYDYLDFKNQLRFFGNTDNRDDKITEQDHYTWNPPVDWDKFINYREYYWEPSGPPTIAIRGQTAKIISTYKVVLGTTGNSFIFTPDSYTNNPTITLYRGQTYKFKINAPGEGFSIRTNYDTGSLIFKPYVNYPAGSLVAFDGKLWRAKQNVSAGDGSSITIDSQDWEYVELTSNKDALAYTKGVTNNGIENGTLTFEVPYDAPDTLFYQGQITPECFGRFIIANIEENTYINVDADIIGKSTYLSSNGIEFSNGMIIEFTGSVIPSKYASSTWLVEGVGEAITLTNFSDLVIPVLTTDVPEVLFDNEGFDSQPFDDATSYPTYKDYITISRDSIDRNPWSRYNRWFHRSVLEKAYSLRGQDFSANEASRAKRPVIEFSSNLQLFNHGSVAKQTVDYIDTFTSDIFSTVEGSTGYNVDGEFLFEGARVLVVADTDILANNKIYEVQFITHNNKKQIHLKKTQDSESIIGEGVLVRRGTNNGGKMFHFDGVSWLLSQAKISVNQAPLFDIFDSNGLSFSNQEIYPTSTFVGSKIISYKLGNSVVDKELGFSISYLNINNVGDIQFDWNWDIETFDYTINRLLQTAKISTGFYKFNPNNEYQNGWTLLDAAYLQPIIDSQVISASTKTVTFNTVDWNNLINEPTINFYINGIKYSGNWTRNLGVFTFDQTLSESDVVSLKIITDIEPDEGYYEIPLGLEKNPFNSPLTSFTLGQAIDHITTALEFDNALIGILPGNSNLRDLSGYRQHAKRFLKRSGVTPLAIMATCDKTHNIIKSIQYSKKAYTDFKNNFLNRALEIDYNESIVDFVDDIINSLTKTKTEASPFSDSGMIGSGAFTLIEYEVEDTGIKTFSLSTKFDLTTLSRNAVYVYVNGRQLLNSQEYTFNSTFGYVQLLIELYKFDKIEIREYISSAVNHIPPTPSAMGLYKKYTPMKFVDDTYVEPREVIQGHDGSITATFGDFRDDLLLELEYRIYNNIRYEYDRSLFDIDNIISGYYGVGLYEKSQLDEIVSQEFLKWIQNTNINYTLNEYFDSENTFTYTYSNMTDPTRTISLPGYWRGVYQWFYDTDRPHRCPWEMLGFSEKPTWWNDVYGPAPYTRNNLILWEDLAEGLIRQGDRAGRWERYKRPSLLNHIPVDGDGKLLSPLDSGLAQDFSLINNRGPFVLGDSAPAEYAWRSSSEWPFAVIMAMCLMKPFKFITKSFDKSKIEFNNLKQPVNVNTGLFTTLDDMTLQTSNDLSVGLVKYLISYTKSRGLSADTLWNKIKNLDVALSYRMSGFVDQQQQKFLLDSKNPNASSASIFVPPENYDIIFNVGAPMASVAYSGVILEKTEGGWIATGYDDIQPFFNYHTPLASQRDPVITVGGVSENFLEWTENKTYNNGTLVRYSNDFYRALKTHDSGDQFESINWQKLSSIPKVGAVEALRRRSFNTLSVKRLSYGTKFTTVQQVVDFLLGYESYLVSQGFTFDRYDAENQTAQDWLSATKEFMFWTKHNWEIGSLISLSPSAEKINITVPVGVSDNILDGFYNYQVLKGDGKPLDPRFINVNRSFQNVTIETTNTTDGIFYLKLYYVLKEHVTIFDDRTVFNDIIYDKTTGYRQGRIKVQGFRTVDWDGDYTSPGFLFDNVDIKTWQPWTDYRLGDIVAYKSYNWTSLVNQLGTETFNDTNWTKLDSNPTKQLIPNFDYKVKQFSDYFEVSSEGVSQSQRDLARHTIGYQQRDYLQNLSEDPVTQFQLYQGFVREKGTANSINKIFSKLSNSGNDSITLNEEWAFLLGKLGGTDQISEVEIQLIKNKFELNPQLFLIENGETTSNTDQHYRLTVADFTISPTPYSKNINPLSLETEPTVTAGYVARGQYEHVISSRSQLTSLDITTVNENDHIWVTFDRDSWTVLRVNESPLLHVTAINRLSDTSVELTVNRPHELLIDEYVGFREIPGLTGFYKIINVSIKTITVEVDSEIPDPVLDESTLANLQLLSNSRVASYSEIDQESAALYKNKSRIFVDNNGDSIWEVVEKNKQYLAKSLLDYGTVTPLNAGTAVVYDNTNKQIFSSIPASALVTIYAEGSTNLVLKQIISPPNGYYSSVLGSFGKSIAVSADGMYLIVGSPEASGVRSVYRGDWSTGIVYRQDDIVLYESRLWKAKNTNVVEIDGSSTAAVNTDDWELATSIPAIESGASEGYYQQGMISIYKYRNGRFEFTNSFVSPRPADNEKFGSNISISFDGTNYIMAVSATGAFNNTGRVYLYKFDGTSWTHLENTNYRGEYNPAEIYYAGDIVWQAAQDPVLEGVKGNLWQALEDQIADGSTITLESMNWVKVNDISTNCSLPTSVSLEDDGTTLLEFAYTGLLDDMQLAEIVKQGDQFGSSVVMNGDASILVVGSPYSDGQYFSNYRGVWRPDVEYVENEVVRFKDLTSADSYIYYRLVDVVFGADSTLRSLGERPDESSNWIQISDSTVDPSGKVFVYKKTANYSYTLIQMINAGSITSFSDIGTEIISTGDQFGFAVDLDLSGNTLVVSSPKADINYQDQGSVYVFNLNSSGTEFRLTQKLQSFEIYPNEYFGSGVSISPDGQKIAVGARNSVNALSVVFDLLEGTTFDNARTTFVKSQGYAGAVYVFDKKVQTFFLTEKLEAQLSPNEGFGYSIDCVGTTIVVGSPFYKQPTILENGDIVYDEAIKGTVRLFKEDTGVSSWNVIGQQKPVVDIRKIRSVELYDNVKNEKIQDVDYIDLAKGKILNLAEQEIKFKTPYDPAVYSVGTDEVVVDSAINWLERNVGKLWWNVGTSKWIYAEQGDTAYRTGNWNQLVEGGSIDVYEWVESPLLPSEWAAVADTNEGLVEGISGQPLYPNDDVYSFKQYVSSITGQVSETLYYYWVKGKTTVPKNMPDRKISSAAAANLISNPTGSGVAFISFIDADKFVAYNFESVMQSDTALLNIQYRNDLKPLTQIHREYQLLTEGVADSLPAKKLEDKWIDSLIGSDPAGNRVPDAKLPAKQKYGVGFRPRQGMIVNRLTALKIAVENINTILLKEAFADTINFTNLNLVDEAPASVLNLYDTVVDTDIDLQAVGTVRTRQAILKANIVDGELDTIEIVDSGFGYKVVPPVVLDGDGIGAAAEVTLDNQGRITSVLVTARGKKYSTILATVRFFSVLVVNDSTINNFWSIYAWDNVRRVFFRSQSQAFDTTRYWSYIDWWKSGYSELSRVTKELSDIYTESQFTIDVGDLIRVKEYTDGGWAIFEKISDTGETFLDRYTLVGRQNGTIQLDNSLYDTGIFGIGFDNTQSFDNANYDIENAKELRNIFKAVKEDIFVGDYAVEWNKLFFSSIRYILAEQQYVDWVFKTSFLNATHSVGPFEQKVNYKNDNLESYQDYIDEVKPYRTTVREYISRYNDLELYGSSTTDFDLPPTYSNVDGKVVPITENRSELAQYPWKWWADNNGYSVTEIKVYAAGEQYRTPPTVLIEGNGTGATAQAYIANGRVSAVVVLTPGSGYTKAPTITLVGGNASGADTAKAVAILGDTKVRTFDLTMKFDRTAKQGNYQNFNQSQTFTASGLTSVFELNYAPTRDKTKITILKNNQVVLNSDYSISLYYAANSSSILKGKLLFETSPAAGDIIVVEYEKNIELLNAVDRIEKYYSPTSGMVGKELGQLMTGVDFGGVQIQGTTFDVTGGWDALPWFTDNWDSVEASSDYYHVCDGSTTFVVLPYVPAAGQEINIYIKRFGETTSTRIDDLFFNAADDSSTASNPTAEMPTFIGDGANAIVEIGQYIETYDGDILIFRPIESDGSVTITDENLLDTRLSGGSLSAIDQVYVTATGTTAEEISISGGKFVEPDHVPAPEENVPGQVLDSVSIRVFQSSVNGAAALQSKISEGNGVDFIYKIGQRIIENNSVFVYIDKIKQEFNVDYTIDLENYNVEFTTAPAIGSIVEILSVGIGGLGILDYKEFTADGTTNLFLTDANYDYTSSVFVTVDGEFVDTGFRNSSEITDSSGKTLVEFGFNPELGSTVKIVCLRASADVDSSGLAVVKVNTQTVYFEGSTRSFDLDNFVELSRGSSRNSMIVEVNGTLLTGADTIYTIYDGSTNQFTLGIDPEEPAGSILPSDIKVYINNILKTFITDYVYDGTSKVLTINRSSLVLGDTIKIENNFRSQYSIDGNNLIISSDVEMTTLDETDNVRIDITWFSEYPSLDIISDQKSGGKVQYALSRIPVSASYVWVYKNGSRLVQDKDFYVSLPRAVVYLTVDTTPADEIKTFTFTSDVFKLPSAFEIHKDMLNVYHYNRFVKGSVTLSKPLNYYDTTLEISDASLLTDPIRSRNVPGIIYISGERIEYMLKTGNVLSQLRRGTQGTSIGEIYSAGTEVVDIGYAETIPYNESQEREDFVSDGSSLLVGLLSFTPSKATRKSWYRSSIPDTYGACDQIEVFAAGRRLRKDPISVWVEENGAYSPDADEMMEAEFSVDGVTAQIRLSQPLPAGTRITVIKRTGKIWYERSSTTASNGVSLLDSDTAIAKFIASKSTSLPE